MANPSIIREHLIKHLAMSRQLHYEAKKILKLKFKTKTLKETITDVAKNKNLTLKKLKKKVEILKEKQKYFALKNALEADPITSDIHEIATKYKFPMIYDEINKRRAMGRSYRYDPVIQLQKIFTYSEENKIMNNLCAWEGTNDCKCQLCALIHLSDIAYKFAKKKANCPKKWKKKADLTWLYYFEMRHTKLFRKNFDSVKECKNFQSEVLQIFIEPHISGSSSSSASSMQGNQSPASFNVSPVLEIESRQSTSGLQHSFDVSLQSSIPRAPQQEGSESHQGSNVHIMEYIKEHINLSHQLRKAANQVLYEKKNIIDIALENDLDLWILQRKVEISKRTNKYLEHKFKRAVKDFSFDPNIQNSDNKTKLSYIAHKNDIGEEFKKHLDNEIRRHLTSDFDYYSYEKIIISYEVFTSEEEEEILEQLYQRDADCHCQLCAMEYLIDLGYIFAKQKNIRVYPSVWNIYEKVDELWLLEFEMRNSEQIVLYPSTSLCKWSPASTEFSSSEQTEPTNTSSPRHQRKRIKSSKDSKVLKPEEKLNKIKGWIKKHLEISHQLDKAAKRVVQKNKDIGEVAHNRNLDLWMLNKKVHIIKFRKTQFDIKRDHEDAVNAVKFNILSVSSAAKEYGVDKDFIHDKLNKLMYLNSNVYIHDEKPKTDDTVLEWDEEFLLLNNLQRQVSDDPNCNCRSCTLQKLPSLAYEFVKQSKRPYYPSAWNTTGKADVIWTCEFIMRHSREISNYFQKECMADLVSNSPPESLILD